MRQIFANAKWRAAQKVAQYQKNHEGATALEFAIVVLPFLALLFGVIELCLIFFISSTLAHATTEAGRVVRTGNFQGCGGADEFKALICNNMSGLGDCWNTVRVDVDTEPSFKTIILPDIPEPEPEDPSDPNSPEVVDLDGEFATTIASSQPVIVRALLYYPLALPSFLTRLDNPKGSGMRILSATTAFKTEPYPTSTSCNADVLEKISSGTPSS